MTAGLGLAQDNTKVDYGELLAQAEMDSKADVTVNSTGWGVGAFLASVVASPLLGGGITVIMAGNVGDVKVPASRRQVIMEKYPNSPKPFTYYEDKYVANYTQIKKKGQRSAAWKGVGAGFLLNLIIIYNTVSDI
ncbi:MAG: hypothetical protein GWP19_08885 [Planctomycetia bacterium]|nr:hypothetical protein [Planctomycetia bacterium]